jgi:hypothetical protein
MSGYNPNYFDRKLVNSMKNAISQIVVKEQFPGTAEGQPGLGLGQISDLELQKRMRNKKNTSIFNKNPKQSKEYLELEAEANRRAAATSQTQTPAQTQAPAPTTTTAPVSSGGGKSLFAPDVQKTAPTPAPTPTPTATSAPEVPLSSRLMSNAPPTSRFWRPDLNVPTTRVATTSGVGPNKGISGVDPSSLPPAGQQQMQAAISTPAAIDSALKQGRNVLDDTQRGKVSDPTTYTPKSKAMASKADQMSAQSGGLLGVLTNMVKGFEYAGKKLPSQQVAANASPSQEMVSGPSQQELQAAQNAAPAPANWAANSARRAQAAGDRDRLRRQQANRMQGSNRYNAGI